MADGFTGERALLAEIDQLQAALKAAKQKLRIYYEQTKGEYAGGEPYDKLMKQIDNALDTEP
jgi:hypothetical protein